MSPLFYSILLKQLGLRWQNQESCTSRAKIITERTRWTFRIVSEETQEQTLCELLRFVKNTQSDANVAPLQIRLPSALSFVLCLNSRKKKKIEGQSHNRWRLLVVLSRLLFTSVISNSEEEHAQTLWAEAFLSLCRIITVSKKFNLD